MTDKNEAMSEQGIIFGDLTEELQRLFCDMPAPDSGWLKWGHVEAAKKINADLREMIEFLTP